MVIKREVAKPGRPLVFVDTTVPASGTANRDPGGATVWRSGRVLLNANGSDIWDEVARKSNVEPRKACARFAVDEKQGVVAVFAVESGTLGSVRVIRYPERPEATFHLGGVFETHDYLRPGGTRSVIVQAESTDNDIPYLILDMGTAMVKPRTRRSSKSAQAAQGKEPEAPKAIPAAQPGPGAGATSASPTASTTENATRAEVAQKTVSQSAPKLGA